MIKNIWNPSHIEIRAWAYSGAVLPHPHWASTLLDFNNLYLLVEIAGDRSCANRTFFLECLYAFSDHVIERGNMHDLGRLESTLEKLEAFEQPEEIGSWIRYSKHALPEIAACPSMWRARREAGCYSQTPEGAGF